MISAQRPDGQGDVDRYFDAASDYWHDVYADPTLQGLVYRRRLQVVLDWTHRLGLAAGSPVLDAGCGAGHLAVALAQASLAVTASDSSPQMTEHCARSAAAAGLADRVTVVRADALGLPFADGQFALVCALGLLPWVSDAPGVVAELARVVAPGGRLIVTADNRRRLNRLLEPREQPLLAPVKRLRNRALRRRPQPGSVDSYRHTAEEVDAMLAAAGITVELRTTVGYGPFTLLGRDALPDRLGTGLHAWLERASERRAPLRRVGWHYVVAGRRAADAPTPTQP